MTDSLGRLLVVDDEEMNCDMLSRRLEIEGYETVCADIDPTKKQVFVDPDTKPGLVVALGLRGPVWSSGPLALNLHVFLDDVTEFNGPLYFIPGSHREGPAPATLDTASTSYPLWVADRKTVARLASRSGLVSATGPRGTVLIFGDVMVHASPPNLSPWSRRIFSLIVNPTDNRQTSFQRPDYKHHRDFNPIVPLEDDCLEIDEVALSLQ